MVRGIPDNEVHRAGEIIDGAFARDPMWTYLFPDEGLRRDAGPAFARTLVQYARRWGKAWGTYPIDAVALRRNLGAYPYSIVRMLQTGILQVPRAAGPSALLRLLTLTRDLESRHREAGLSCDHWHLWMLAVDPAVRGTGRGRELMNHTFRQIDAAGQWAYLETATETNVAIHGKHGFRVVSDRMVPGTSLRMWTMVRRPTVLNP